MTAERAGIARIARPGAGGLSSAPPPDQHFRHCRRLAINFMIAGDLLALPSLLLPVADVRALRPEVSAAALGLTTCHANCPLRQLRERRRTNLIRRNIRIGDRPGLTGLAHFRGDYLHPESPND
jgi:hypothetical protein